VNGAGAGRHFDVITLFPEMFGALTASGITRRAQERGLYARSAACMPSVSSIRGITWTIRTARWTTGLMAADRAW